MTQSDDSSEKLRAVVLVRCERCSRRGKGTRLGEMVLAPSAPNDRWGWLPLVRLRDNYMFGDRSIVRGNGRVIQFSGGIEAPCRRCGATPRASIRRLAQLAQDTHEKGLTEILL